MAEANVYLKAFIFVTCFTFSVSLELSDFLPYGSNYSGAATEITVNVNNQFRNGTLVDHHAFLQIPQAYSQIRIYGVTLGREVYVSKDKQLFGGVNSYKIALRKIDQNTCFHRHGFSWEWS